MAIASFVIEKPSESFVRKDVVPLDWQMLTKGERKSQPQKREAAITSDDDGRKRPEASILSDGHTSTL